ncbi:MAG TPA: GvpL/GvpF family gas vesicle protein [Pyrinomonadaceae bacterium]|nr:GvpL/GvpF family gas vesicle protein [Pyrinomonadaceae bacterium]
MKLYVYCFADGLDSPHNLPRGVSGARIRLIKFEDLSLLVSACTGNFFHQIRKNALAHNAVVRSVFNQTTPLPCRFGTIVTDKQLRNYVSTHKQALKNRLAHVRGAAEMNLRINGPRLNTLPASEREQAVGPGTRFLLDKRKELRGEEWRAAQEKELSAWLGEKLGGLIRDERIYVVPHERCLLARVDHLVDRSDIEKYREKAGGAIQERPDIRFLVSGPWPPYSFANIGLEFSSQFGVS